MYNIVFSLSPVLVATDSGAVCFCLEYSCLQHVQQYSEIILVCILGVRRLIIERNREEKHIIMYDDHVWSLESGVLWRWGNNDPHRQQSKITKEIFRHVSGSLWRVLSHFWYCFVERRETPQKCRVSGITENSVLRNFVIQLLHHAPGIHQLSASRPLFNTDFCCRFMAWHSFRLDHHGTLHSGFWMSQQCKSASLRLRRPLHFLAALRCETVITPEDLLSALVPPIPVSCPSNDQTGAPRVRSVVQCTGCVLHARYLQPRSIKSTC